MSHPQSRVWQWVQTFNLGEDQSLARSIWDRSGIPQGVPVRWRIVEVYPKALLVVGLDNSIVPPPLSPNSPWGWQAGAQLRGWPSDQEVWSAHCALVRVGLGFTTPLISRQFGAGTFPPDPAPTGEAGAYIPWGQTSVSVAHAASQPVSAAIWLRSPSGVWSLVETIAPTTTFRRRFNVDADADRIYYQALAGVGPADLVVDFGTLTQPQAKVNVRYLASEVI